MAASNRHHRFTIYDMMEAKGVFEENPANADSGKYKGPEQFPRMVYHPKGEFRVTAPAEVVMTPFGPQQLFERKELISRVVNSKSEFDELVKEGWHDHPAKAIAAGGGVAPPISGAQVIESLEEKIKKLEEELAHAQGLAKPTKVA